MTEKYGMSGVTELQGMNGMSGMTESQGMSGTPGTNVFP